MTKEQAEDLIASIQSTGSSRVIIVRSRQALKRFVTTALEAMEEGRVGTSAQGPIDWQQLEMNARQVDCGKVGEALRALELMSALSPQAGAPDSAAPQEIKSAVRALTGLLLRVYIEGHDRNGGGELQGIRDALERLAPGASLALLAPSDAPLN